MTTVLPTQEAEVLGRRGWEALRQQDAPAAGPLFERAVALAPSDANAWYGLAYTRKMLGQTEAHLQALDGALRAAPHHLLALMMKGDHFVELDDIRTAQSFYQAVIKRAPSPEQLPEAVRGEVARAYRALGEIAARFSREIDAALSAAGVDAAGASPRAAAAVDLLLGRRQLFVQQPTAFYFPELPQRAWFEREEFDWIPALEAQTPAIKAELAAVMSDGDGAFEPYVRSDPSRPPPTDPALVDDPSWSAFYLYRGGHVAPGAAERCPRTLAALQNVPLTHCPGRTPSVLFSMLRPHAKIPPHHGQLNTRLICHLPLITPPDCQLRVGAEARPWVEGRTLIFDDTIEHEAWNNSDQTRVVLLFEVWRPELTAAERAAIEGLLSAVPAFTPDGG